MLLLGILLLLSLVPLLAGADEVIAARVWPAKEYTRVTLESKNPIQYEMRAIPDPARIVIDLENITLTRSLAELADKINQADPYVSKVRVGRFKPQVTRVVFDLKQEVNPRAFIIEPIGEYRYRLVLDLYPTEAVDPLVSLLAEIDRPAQAQAPEVADNTDKTRKPKKTLRLPRMVTVAIDAGHGGEDPGAKGHHGAYEKDITLAIARELKKQVDAQPNMRAVLIRDDDYFIPLGERVNRARRVRADLFVSVHADAFNRPDARGSSVFALSEKGATSAAARWLAKRENAADLIGGIDLGVADSKVKQVLFDLSQTATLNDSLKLGRAVLKKIGTVNTLHKARVEQAGFAVLKAPDIPSILVETAFITNAEEEKNLQSEAYRRDMAGAIVAGIVQFFIANPPADRTTKVAGPIGSKGLQIRSE